MKQIHTLDSIEVGDYLVKTEQHRSEFERRYFYEVTGVRKTTVQIDKFCRDQNRTIRVLLASKKIEPMYNVGDNFMLFSKGHRVHFYDLIKKADFEWHIKMRPIGT